MNMQVINIEAQLAGWNTSHKGGSKLVLWVNDEDLEPFKAMTTREGKKAGQRLALAVVQIGDDERPVPQPELEKRKGGPLAKCAGMLCDSREFYEWIRPIYDRKLGGNGRGHGDVTPDCFKGGIPEYCAHAIKVICNIETRRDLDHDAAAAAIFHDQIRLPFLEYQKTANRKAQECEA